MHSFIDSKPRVTASAITGKADTILAGYDMPTYTQLREALLRHLPNVQDENERIAIQCLLDMSNPLRAVARLDVTIPPAI